MKKLLTKKTLSLAAMIISVLIALSGFLIITGAFGGNTSHANSSYLYDSGLTKFGADFYTYVNNNAAEAAMAARTVASNLDSIADVIKSACGIFLIGFGLLSLCCFTMVWISENKPAEVVAQPTESVQNNVVFEETTENIIKTEAPDSEPATENEISEENSSTDSE
jgi:hypothetical protein